MQDLTPGRIALFSAAAVAFISLIAGWLLSGTEDLSRHLVFFLYAAVVFLVAYLITYLLLDRIIYSRIRQIHKTIYNLKAASTPIKSIRTGDLIREITQAVLALGEDKRQEIEGLKKLETYRREFLGNVSHELKTPIFNIQGYIHTLIDGGIKDKAVNMEFLEKAARSADRLSAIVEDLEIISQLESGKLVLETESFDIRQLAAEVYEALDIQAKANHIKLAFAENNHVPVQVSGDRERIRQVLVNLVTNSIKYGRDKGKTMIRFLAMDDTVVTEVSDNGIGIESKHLPRLFERFYRVDKSRSREKGGTGLGLAIVKHIIEAHNQSITVHSEVGLGSAFSFTLKKS